MDSEARAAKLAVVNAKLALAKAQEALLLAKRKKNSRDVKPRVTPPPPFDWRGRPPIDLGKRIYVDYDKEEAQHVEEDELKREADERKAKEDARTRLRTLEIDLALIHGATASVCLFPRNVQLGLIRPALQ